MTYRLSKSVHSCDLCTWLRNPDRDKEPKQCQTGYLPRPPTSSDQDAVLRGAWTLGDSCYYFQVWSELVQQLLRCEGSKSGLLHYFGQWLIQPCTTVQTWLPFYELLSCSFITVYGWSCSKYKYFIQIKNDKDEYNHVSKKTELVICWCIEVEWSASGDDGAGADESFHVHLHHWLWHWWRPPSMAVRQV